MSAAEKALALLNGLRDAVTNLPVRGADPRLAKAFLRVSDCIFELEQWCMESTALEDRALIAACAPYLKDGETPAECIARNRADIDSVLTLLAQAKQSVQHLATCATNGHVYGHAGACIFCGEPKSTPVEPAGASEPRPVKVEVSREWCVQAARNEPDVDITVGASESPSEKAVVGTWPAAFTGRAFVDGAAWWLWQRSGATMYPSERDEAEAEALDRYGATAREPEPCVWRDDHGITRTTCGMTLPEGADDHTYCGYCGAPLKVER